MRSPLTFSFDVEPGLTPSEIELLWNNTQTAQQAMDRFLAGEYTEQELTDLLDYCEVNIDQAREQLDQNAQAMGMILID